MDLNCAVKSAEERGEKDGWATSTKQTTISARKKFNAGEIKLGQHQDIRNKWKRRQSALLCVGGFVLYNAATGQDKNWKLYQMNGYI